MQTLKRKKILILILCAVLLLAMVPAGRTYAASSSSTKSQLNNVKKQKSDVYEKMNETAKKLESYDKQVAAMQKTINAKTKEYQSAVNQLAAMKQKVAKQEQVLGLRVRAMYKTGAVGYIDIILSSNSLSDLVSNVEMVKRIYTKDQDTLTEIQTQTKAVAAKEAAIKQEKQELEAKQASLKTAQAKIAASVKQLKKQYAGIVAQEKSLQAKLDAAAAKVKDVPNLYTGGVFQWPCRGTITTVFGYRRSWDPYSHNGHSGIDIGVPSGTPIHACADGVVVLSGGYGGYGYAVMISHGSGLQSLYGHNSSLLVRVGQHVKKGQVIARAGSTGFSTGPHCHFEVRKNGTAVNPMNYL